MLTESDLRSSRFYQDRWMSIPPNFQATDKQKIHKIPVTEKTLQMNEDRIEADQPKTNADRITRLMMTFETSLG